jgi:hypothetical protein
MHPSTNAGFSRAGQLLSNWADEQVAAVTDEAVAPWRARRAKAGALADTGAGRSPRTTARQVVIDLIAQRTPLAAEAMQDAVATYGALLIEQDLGERLTPPPGMTTAWQEARNEFLRLWKWALGAAPLCADDDRRSEDQYLIELTDAGEKAEAAGAAAARSLAQTRPGNLFDLQDKAGLLMSSAVDMPADWLAGDLAYLADLAAGGGVAGAETLDRGPPTDPDVAARRAWTTARLRRDTIRAAATAYEQELGVEITDDMREMRAAAELAVFTTPSPDLQAVLWKLTENLITTDGAEPGPVDEVLARYEESGDHGNLALAAIGRDLQRLAGNRVVSTTAQINPLGSLAEAGARWEKAIAAAEAGEFDHTDVSDLSEVWLRDEQLIFDGPCLSAADARAKLKLLINTYEDGGLVIDREDLVAHLREAVAGIELQSGVR